MASETVTIEKIAALCRRRAFVFPSSDIYGGLGSQFDFGHYGVLLNDNVKAEWRRAMIQERDDVVALTMKQIDRYLGRRVRLSSPFAQAAFRDAQDDRRINAR